MKNSGPIEQQFQRQFLHPKYWPTWLFLGLAALVVKLPWRTQIWIGERMGQMAFFLARHRRHIAEVNLKLCFPDKSETERGQLLRQVFRSNGIGLIETANAWLLQPSKFQHRFTLKGTEHLGTALARGKGVLMIGMHFSTLDLAGAVLAQSVPFDVMYRRNKNLLLEAVMTRGRRNNFPNAIERTDIRGVIRCLKSGHAVWYGPDQDYGRKHSVFAPFFSVSAASITATARITKMTSAAILSFSHYREPGDKTYVIEISPALENFPSGNEVQDATTINRLVEDAIKKAPDQYWWIHRRFKTRPEGEKRPYQRRHH